MTRSPLLRACAALRLPRGLYLLQGDLPLSDAEIRANLRRQPPAAERLALALADVLASLVGGQDADGERQTPEADDVWRVVAEVIVWRELPPSVGGMLAALAMLPEGGAVEPDEWALVVEAAP